MSTPPGWDASPLQGYPSKINKFASSHLYSWVERGTESKVSFTTTQHNVPSQGLNLDLSIRRPQSNLAFQITPADSKIIIRTFLHTCKNYL